MPDLPPEGLGFLGLTPVQPGHQRPTHTVARLLEALHVADRAREEQERAVVAWLVWEADLDGMSRSLCYSLNEWFDLGPTPRAT